MKPLTCKGTKSFDDLLIVLIEEFKRERGQEPRPCGFLGGGGWEMLWGMVVLEGAWWLPDP